MASTNRLTELMTMFKGLSFPRTAGEPTIIDESFLSVTSQMKRYREIGMRSKEKQGDISWEGK